MQKSRIEWTNYTWNPITGCTYGCSYCYGRKMANNPFYHKAFPFQFVPHFYPERFKELQKIPDSSKVFVCSMAELFATGQETWTEKVLCEIWDNPQLTFQLLTKQPQNLIKWSPFPDNCWVGASATNETMAAAACARLSLIEAKVKFLSIEPLLSWDCQNALNSRFHWQQNYHDINWLIIGQQTPPKKSTRPELAWVQNILVAMSNAGNIPVFMKNNLEPLLTGEWSGWKLRQEFPSPSPPAVLNKE